MTKTAEGMWGIASFSPDDLPLISGTATTR
jgi:hypothetical protein